MTKKLKLLGLVLIIGIVVLFCIIRSMGDRIPYTNNDFIDEIILGKKFQLEYYEEVKNASDEFGVPEDMILAVIKTESNFIADSQSSAGAKGLMQLMPDTFSWVAMRLGEPENPENICDIVTNIRYGTYYLSFLMERLENEETVYAAYNAGYNRIKGWLADERYSHDGKTLYEIPYEETSDYVIKVSKAREKYKNILSEQNE